MSATKRALELIHSRLLRRPVEVDEVALARSAHRADRARALLEDELLSEAFAKVESHYIAAWRSSASLEVDLRERSWMAVQLLADLRNTLISFVREGEVAKKKIAQINEHPAE